MTILEDQQNYNFQKKIVVIGVVLFLIKIAAWYLTHSVSILTDALESIINVLAGSFTLYSLYVSSIPKDNNHPYGHGKIEFIAAGIEGTLIIIAGLFILYEATTKLIWGNEALQQLNYGIFLIAFAGFINYLLGYLAVKRGTRNKSLALIAGGKHLISDAYSSVALIIGLVIVLITHQYWIDSVVALFFGGVIIYTGFKIIRSAVAGIMDEADEALIDEFVSLLNQHRSENWVDIHKVRFIKYGGNLHLDCHLTLPWYFNLKEAHTELDQLEKIVKNQLEQRFEMFVHTDDCTESSCNICTKNHCAMRQHAYIQSVVWTRENISKDSKHSLKNISTHE